MIRYLPVVLELGIVIYCLVDISQADRTRVRNLPKGWWIVLVIVVPLLGGLAWLLGGRPQRPPQGGTPLPRRPGPVAPEDDPEFIARLRQSNSEHEHLLRQWEDELRSREQRLQRPPRDAPPPDGGSDDPPAGSPPTGG